MNRDEKADRRDRCYDCPDDRHALADPTGCRHEGKNAHEPHAAEEDPLAERSGEEVELGKILVWEPPHRFAYSWHPGAIDKPTEVEVTFRSYGDHTVVTVTHAEAKSDLGDSWPSRAARFARAWEHLLPKFGDLVKNASDTGLNTGEVT